jgi:dihydroorotate dehydrogenase (NAD+) catalytic subunit
VRRRRTPDARTPQAAPPGVSVDLSVDLAGIVLPNPIIAASGTFWHGAEVAALCPPAALGAVTVKSLHADPWAGNPAPRLHAAPGGGMLNSVGLQGPGVAFWVDHDLPELLALGARVIASIWGRSVEDFGRAAKLLSVAGSRLTAVEVNISCPNVEDSSRMFAHSVDATERAVAAVVEVDLGLPIFAKLSPNTYEVVDIARAAVGQGATGLTLVNTLMGFGIDAERRRPQLGAGSGGLSGAPIKPIALRAVYEVARALPDTPIIGTGGVVCGVDAVEMMLAGAAAVGVGTATFRDPTASIVVRDELALWCDHHGIAAVRDLTGALEES